MSPEQADTAGRVAVRGAAARSTAAGVWETADPAGPGGQFMLNAVAMADPDLVWAVGQAAGGVLVESWDGHGWATEPGLVRAAELQGAVLQGVDCAGRSAAIAVGGAFDRIAVAERPLAYGWDGLGWQDLELPDLGSGYVLTDVSVRVGDDAWAVGSSGRPVALHWDGSKWRPAELPEVGEGRLTAVAAARDTVWAVGVAGGGADRRPLILRYDGLSWQEVRCPIKAKRLPRGLSSVAVAADGVVWAGGGGTVLRCSDGDWRAYDAKLSMVNTVAVSSGGAVWAAGGKGGSAVLENGAFKPMPAPGEEALWLGAAANGETVWLVGSRQERSHGERSATASDRRRARHLSV